MRSVRSPLLSSAGLTPTRRSDLSSTLANRAGGVRVRRAAADAAGLGVATDLETDAISMQMALRNIEDGTSAIDVADGGMREVETLLQRLRSLAMAGSSETLADEERAYLDDEAAALTEELERTVISTRFGGEPLLATGAVDIMLLADTSASMGAELPVAAVELANLRDRLLSEGLSVRTGVAQVNTNASGGDPIDGSETLTPLDDDVAATDAALASLWVTGAGQMDPYTVLLDQSGITPLAGRNGPEENPFGGPSVQKILIYVSDTGLEASLTSVTEAQTAVRLASAGFRVYATTQIPRFQAVFDGITDATNGLLKHLDPSGSNLTALVDAIGDDILKRSDRTEPFTVQTGIHDSIDDRLSLDIPVSLSTTSLGIEDLSLATVSDARAALTALDGAFVVLNRARSTVGAAWNRLHAAGNNIKSIREAVESGESQIRDADMAELTSQSGLEQLMLQTGIVAQMQAAQLHRDAIPALLG